MEATTILAVRTKDGLAIGGDGQVSQGNLIIKHNVQKVRWLNNRVLAGFAGVTADAMLIFDRLEGFLMHFPELTKACVELVRDWRKNTPKLEAYLIVADESKMLMLTGCGDLIQPDDDVLGIGSGGSMAVAAAKALMRNTGLTAPQIVKESLKIASEMCVFTNQNIQVLTYEEEQNA